MLKAICIFFIEKAKAKAVKEIDLATWEGMKKKEGTRTVRNVNIWCTMAGAFRA